MDSIRNLLTECKLEAVAHRRKEMLRKTPESTSVADAVKVRLGGHTRICRDLRTGTALLEPSIHVFVYQGLGMLDHVGCRKVSVLADSAG
jgi:hypothetical protein